MNNQVQSLYQKTQANTANPGELTLMLYNGCIKFMKQASEDIRNKKYESKNTNILKAQAILDELIVSLDSGFEISENLRSLYIFIKEQLIEANMRLNQEKLQQAIDFITELRDTWAEALKKVKAASKVSS